MKSDRFTYQGRHLREWLLQLVDDSRRKRRQAGEVITSRFAFFCEPSLADTERHHQTFQNEVRAALNQSCFPTEEFGRRLLRLCLEQRVVVDRWHEANGKWHQEQHRRMGKQPTVAQQIRYLGKSITRLNRREKTLSNKGFEEANDYLVSATTVMACLGRELLPAKKEIRQLLKHPSLDNEACAIITQMGKDGLVFLPNLMSGLKKKDGGCPHTKTLGHLLRLAPERIPECFELTKSKNKILRSHAAVALGFCGREALRPFPKIEAAARKRLAAAMETKSIGWWPVLRTAGDYEWHAWAWMLGEIAVTKATVNEFLKVTRGEHKHRVGKAIECLGRTGLDGKRVVPRLIELMDGFVEFDHREGAQARVTEALRSFGREAKPAIPALSRHIWMELKIFDGEPRKVPDYTVIRLLGAMGKDAKEVLPALRRMKKQLSQEELNPELGEAIGKISGKR